MEMDEVACSVAKPEEVTPMEDKERKYFVKHRIVEIENLSQFIDLINTLPSDRYSYRGESDLHFERTSSALRPYDGTQDSEKEYPYEKMIKDYYYETSHVLSGMERANFIAFAQHYGIPTNLVDVSFSPLVALFFACSPKNMYEYEKKRADRTGYVYFLRSDGIDITSVIEKDPFVNVARELTDDRNPHFAELSKLIQDYYDRHRQECLEDLYLVIQQILLLDTEDTRVEKRRYEAVLSAVKDGDDRQTTIHADGMFQHMFGEEWKKRFDYPPKPTIFWWYVAFVRAYLVKLLTHRKRVYYFDFLPNFVYKPVMGFERGRSQAGYFMFQSYLTFLEGDSDYWVLAQQRVKYERTIAMVTNPVGVKEELDNVGINLKTIFRDFDSIAKYILSKYRERIPGEEERDR